MSTSVTRDYTATAYPSGIGRSGALRLQLSWTAGDPYAVELTFPTRHDIDRPWVLSRELLEQGMGGPVGVGDVRCACDGDFYTITLHGSGPQDGVTIDLKLRRLWVTDFLTATTLAPGTEPYGDALDSALAELFGEAA